VARIRNAEQHLLAKGAADRLEIETGFHPPTVECDDVKPAVTVHVESSDGLRDVV
jgi:hypothetical protein